MVRSGVVSIDEPGLVASIPGVSIICIDGACKKHIVGSILKASLSARSIYLYPISGYQSMRSGNRLVPSSDEMQSYQSIVVLGVDTMKAVKYQSNRGTTPGASYRCPLLESTVPNAL